MSTDTLWDTPFMEQCIECSEWATEYVGPNRIPLCANCKEDPEEWPIIHRYTRAQAIADGVLHDISKMAKEAGFRYPVAITAAVKHDLEDIPPTRQNIESFEGRLWDMLTVARFRAKLAAEGAHEIQPRMILTRLSTNAQGRRVFTRDYRFTVHIGPGDQGEPVITIMRPDED